MPTSTELISVTTGLVGPGDRDVRHAGAARGVARAVPAHGSAGLPAVQRAGRRFRPGRAAAAGRCGTATDGCVDGQKVWSSGARFADFGLLLARTDPDVVKQAGHHGVPAADGRAGRRDPADPADERRQRRSTRSSCPTCACPTTCGSATSARAGGWRTATLGFERTASGSGTGARAARSPTCSGSPGRSAGPATRSCASSWPTSTSGPAAGRDRPTGSPAPPRPARRRARRRRSASSLASRPLARTGEVAADLLGAAHHGRHRRAGAFAWTEHVLGAPGYRLAGGTDEIQRNIIAERVLGLPARAARATKDVPCSDTAPQHSRCRRPPRRASRSPAEQRGQPFAV